MNEGIRIECMTADDIEMVHAMDVEALGVDSWPIKWFQDGVNDPLGHYFVAYCGEEAVGYCGMYNNASLTPSYCKIATLGVKQSFRRKGIGKALMLKMLDTARELGLDRTKLEVDTKNSAIKLYMDLGFKTEGFVEGYYDKSGGDAYIMWYYDDTYNS